MTRGVSSARTSDEGLFWIFKFVFPVQYWDSLRRRRGSAGEKDGRRPVGVKETITSGKKKDPREAGKKGRRSDDDCRGKEGGEPGPPLGRERRKEGRKGQRGKGKIYPKGEMSESEHCTALPLPSPPSPPSSIQVFLSVRFSLGADIGECRSADIFAVSSICLSGRGALSLLRISVTSPSAALQ